LEPLLASIARTPRAGEDRAQWIDELLRAFANVALIAGTDSAAEWLLDRLYAEDIVNEPSLAATEADDEPLLTAVRRVEELAAHPESVAAEDHQGWRWIEAAVHRSMREGDSISDETVLGLAEAFRAKLMSRSVLELARHKIPASRMADLADRVRSLEARAILLDVPLEQRSTPAGRMSFRGVEEPASHAIVGRGPALCPARVIEPSTTKASVSHGPKAPKERFHGI
jgi:hypothetical protein